MGKTWRSVALSPAEVVAHVHSGMTVFVHGAAATPTPLIDALAARTDLENVRIVHCIPRGRLRTFQRKRDRRFGRFRSSPVPPSAAESPKAERISCRCSCPMCRTYLRPGRSGST